MTLYEFNMLDEHEKAEAVWEGVCIGDREEEGMKILLYQVDGFYVEVYYDGEKNEIVKLRSFSSVGQLEVYLERMDIDNILM